MHSLGTMSGQIKELMRKYGKVAVGVHLGVYATTFAGKHPHAHRQCAHASALPWTACRSIKELVVPATSVVIRVRVKLLLHVLASDCAASGIAGLYLAVQNKLDVESTLQNYGLLSSESFFSVLSLSQHVPSMQHVNGRPAAIASRWHKATTKGLHERSCR